MQLDEDIRTFDLEAVAYKGCRDERWSLEEVDQIELEYRAFLQIIRNAEVEAAPTKRIDLFWHHHILDTGKYMADCEALFGRYIHHFPYSGVFGDADAQAQRDRVMCTMDRIRLILDEGNSPCR